MSRISLIISTLGRKAPLIRLLNSLERQTSRDFDIFVVDQNAPGFLDDTLAAYASSLDLKHVHSPVGLSRGRNAALPHVTSDIIGFPDDDCWYGPETIARIIALFDCCPSLDLVVGRTTDDHGRNSIVPSLNYDAPIDRNNVIDIANSNAIFVRREMASAIGPFDERLGVGAATPFQGAEDRDFVARALASGAQCRFFKDLIIFHDQIQTDNGNHLQRIRKYALGDGAYYRKHGYGLSRIMFMSGKALGGIPVRLLRGQSPLIRYKLTYCRALFDGFRKWTA